MTTRLNRSQFLSPLLTLALAACSPSAPSEPAAAQAEAYRSPDTTAYYLVLEGPAAAELIAAGQTPEQARALTRAHVQELGRLHRSVRGELERLGVPVVGELSRLANALLVLASPQQLPALGALSAVERVEQVPLYLPSLLSAVPVIGAPQAWTAATPWLGDGVRIAIVDSGIDYLHADFGGSGDAQAYRDNDPTLIEPGSFPTARVIGGYDFVGDDYDPAAGKAVPQPDPDPLDCARQQSMSPAGGHGTHVAGIAAGQGVQADGAAFTGPYEQSLPSTAFSVGPGVAPRASLLAYKVFGCAGGTNAIGIALERAADPDGDGDFSDRVDVVNASLGTAYALDSGTDDRVMANLARVGTLLVVAAGNDGDATYAVGSPSTAPSALSVAASTDAVQLGLQILEPAALAGEIAAVEGGFTRPLAQVGAVEAPVVSVSPADGCSAPTNAALLAGKLALVDRGTCSFVSKLQRLAQAGALAAIVIDNTDAEVPLAMAGGDPGQVPIPGVMIRRSDGERLRAALSASVRARLDPQRPFGGHGNEQLASFSSRGPSALDAALKPEIAAPGSMIDSARVGSGTEARRSDGTSMACPMVAGAAALARQAHPDLTPNDVKALLMNTAAPLVSAKGDPYTVSLVGGGRVDVARAVTQRVTAAADRALGTVGPSFGALVLSRPVEDHRAFTVTNHGATTARYALSVSATYPLTGVALQVTPSELTLPPGESALAQLSLAVQPAELPPLRPDPVTPPVSFEQPRHFVRDIGGHVLLKGLDAASQDLRLPYFASVRAADERTTEPRGCIGADPSGLITLPLGGSTTSERPVTSAFLLGAVSERRPADDPQRQRLDLLAVGAASDVPQRGWEEGTVYFGLVTAGPWTTPARGQVSLPAVDLDVDLDGSTDYRVLVEPVTQTMPYGDVLAAVTYTAGGQATSSRRFINSLPASSLPTYPFDNSVLLLSAFLRDLELPEGQTRLAYRVRTQTIGLGFGNDATDWIELELAHPALDTTRFGVEGRPFFAGDEPVRVGLGADTPAPSLLLLHHSNSLESPRHEILPLTSRNLRVTASLPPSVQPETHITAQVTVESTSEATSSARLRLHLDGGRLQEVLRGGAVLTPASDGTVLVEGVAAARPAELELRITVADVAELRLDASLLEAGCQSTTQDDEATAVSVLGPLELDLSGGCGCQPAPLPRAHGAWLLGVLTGGLLARRRRRDPRGQARAE